MRWIVLVAMSAASLTCSYAHADVDTRPIKLDASDRRTFEGWGTSLCWWAHRVGDWPAERLDPLLELIVCPENGLGYTIFRYNIGGGDAPGHNHMRPGGDVPGFKPGPDQAYDWTADRNQRRVLLKLRDRVPDAIFEAFSNSPPYWLTVSGCASGAKDGGPNLRADAEEAFADYLTEVIKYYRDKHELVFHTLSPLNEPNANWWRTGHNQEGCHVPVVQQQRLIQAVAKSLRQKRLNATGVAGPETNSLDDCLKNLRAYDDATRAALSQINTHTYAGTRRSALRDFALRHKKRLWQSESGPLGMRGKSRVKIYLAMADRIVQDLNELRATAWLDWQVVDGGVWTCIKVNPDEHTFRKSAKFPFYAIFTRFIRPGDQLVNLDQPHVLAAISDRRRVLTIVAVNSADEASVYRIAFNGVRPSASQAKTVRTSRTESLIELESVPVGAAGVTVRCAPRSVTAILVPIKADHEAAEAQSVSLKRGAAEALQE
jgi:O-glycosyl hydrolase